MPLNREDALLATHASEHNTFPVPGTESTREKHLEKISKRQGRKENKDRRARSHDPAFVRRLPIYIGPQARSIVPGERTLAYSWVLVGLHTVSVSQTLTSLLREVAAVTMVILGRPLATPGLQ